MGLLKIILPMFFFASFALADIPKDELIYNHKIDGSEPIYSPTFLSANKITNIGGDEPLISININGDIRAYPLRILIWHEVVNDVVGGIPVAITYDPLTNTSVVFKREVDGKALKFGSLGIVHKSGNLLYDHETNSWWQQFTGEAISGKLKGKKLESLPLRIESFISFKERQPDSKILIPSDEFARDYGLSPYPGYDSFFPFMYKDYHRKSNFDPMSYMIMVGKKVFPLEMIMVARKVEVDNYVIKWQPEQNSVLSAKAIFYASDIGMVTVQKRTNNGLEDVAYKVTFVFAVETFCPECVWYYK